MPKACPYKFYNRLMNLYATVARMANAMAITANCEAKAVTASAPVRMDVRQKSGTIINKTLPSAISNFFMRPDACIMALSGTSKMTIHADSMTTRVIATVIGGTVVSHRLSSSEA